MIKNMKKEYIEKIKKLAALWNVTFDEAINEIISNLDWIKDDKLFNNIINEYKKQNTIKE